MNYRREPETRLPGWLWFFLILPLSLIGLLLYRRRQELIRRLPARLQQRLSQPVIQPRYTEPDSIPLEIRPGEAGFSETEYVEEDIEAEGPVDEEDTATAAAGAASVGYVTSRSAERDLAGASETADVSDESMGAAEVAADEPTNMGEEMGTPGPVPTGTSTAPGGPDNLEVIEGIGPSIAALLQNRGIRTFRQLADAPMDRLTDILSSARLSHLADPSTWGEQARLAAEGQWDELRNLQSTLKGGRRAKQG